MQRFLALVVTALVLLLFVGSAQRYRSARAVRSSTAASTPLNAPAPRSLPDSVRVAAYALLTREAGQTYLDAMLSSTDSLVRRWPDRGGRPFRIAILEGGSPDYGVRMADFVREATSRWQAADVGLWFSFTGDSSDADIVVQWRESFASGNKAGETNLRWSNAGPVVRAHVSLATRNGGDSLFTDEALLGAAVHELGHAVGLPHSPDSSDVMYPVTRVTVPSVRDRATVRLLYSLPPGSLRAPPPR